MRNPSLRPFPGPQVSPRLTESSSFTVQAWVQTVSLSELRVAPAGPARVCAANEAWFT